MLTFGNFFQTDEVMYKNFIILSDFWYTESIIFTQNEFL